MRCPSIQTRTVMVIVCLLCVYLATILAIVGLTTNNWIEIRERGLYHRSIVVHFGLHRVCWVNNARCNNPGNDYDQQNNLPAVQGLLITGGFISVVACVLTLVNFYNDLLGRSSGLICAVAGAICVIAGLFILISTIMFAVKVEIRTDYMSVGYTEYFGFSFGLTICAGILMFIGAVLNGVTGVSRAAPKFNM